MQRQRNATRDPYVDGPFSQAEKRGPATPLHPYVRPDDAVLATAAKKVVRDTLPDQHGGL
jgi:hypothetical protein